MQGAWQWVMALFNLPQTWMFLWGSVGSLSVEIVSIYLAYTSGAGRLPARYRRWGFWLTRFALTVVAGLLAVAHGIVDKPLVAIHIGASTPIIIQAFARRRPELAENE